MDISVTGLTAAAMRAIRNSLIVSATVDSNTKHLIFTRYDGTTQDAGQVGGIQGPPGSITSSPAGGDLTGSYPNPSIKDGIITAAKIVLGSITDAQISGANKDGAVDTPSLRTIGAGAQQAAAGNHSHNTIPKLKCGVLAHTASAPNTLTKVTYTNVFPVGYFSTIPDIQLTPDTNAADNVLYWAVSDRTLTGFAISAARSTSAATNFHYLATTQAAA